MRVFFIPALFIFTSCIIVTSSIQEAEVTGPARKSTVRLAEDHNAGKIILRPHSTFGQTSQLTINTGTHSNVDSAGQYQLLPVAGKDYFLSPDGVNIYPFEGKNLTWHLPRYQIGLELEIFMDQFALIFGANTALVDNQRFWGGNMGFAWSARYTWWAWRADFNIHFSRLAYIITYINESEFIWPQSNKKYIYIFSEKGVDTNWGSEFCLTLNSNRAEWPVNIWAGLGFGNQVLFDLQDEAPMFGNLSYTDEYSYLSGGIYKNITPNNRIVLGVRWNYHPSQNTGIKYGELILQYEILIDKQ